MLCNQFHLGKARLFMLRRDEEVGTFVWGERGSNFFRHVVSYGTRLHRTQFRRNFTLQCPAPSFVVTKVQATV